MTGLNDRSEVACVLFGGCAAVVCEKCHYTSLNLFQPGVLTPPLPCIGSLHKSGTTIQQSHNPTTQKIWEQHPSVKCKQYEDTSSTVLPWLCTSKVVRGSRDKSWNRSQALVSYKDCVELHLWVCKWSPTKYLQRGGYACSLQRAGCQAMLL